MHETIRGLAALTAFGLLGACASAPTGEATARPTSSDDCFFASTLRDWRPLDNENLILFAIGRRPYHVELTRPAIGLSHDVMIGVYDRDGRICPYGGDAIVVDNGIPDRIPIRSMRLLTDEELDEVYVQFGVRGPAIIAVEEPEAEPAAPR
jgi:hypothetical protein